MGSRNRNVKPYHKLDKWEKIIDTQLLILVFVGIIALISLKVEGDKQMLIDVLINIGCSVITTVFLSLFIYFKYLKKIPDENKRQIEELLNSRLNYETSNHNTILQALNPDNRHLSSEHTQILDGIKAIEINEAKGKANYSVLQSDQKAVVDSVKTLSIFSEILQNINAENIRLVQENTQLKQEMNQYKKMQRQNKNISYGEQEK